MEKGKKLSALLLAIALLFGLAACSGSGGGNAGTESTGGTKPAGTSNEGNDQAADTSKFVKISYVVLGDKPKNGQFEKVLAEVNKRMKEKINAELEWKWVEWADWQTKYNLLLASGEPIDLITIGTDWLDTWGNAQRGAFKPLDELLPKYAPQTWKEIPEEDWAESKYKGQIVLIPENDYTQWVNHGFFTAEIGPRKRALRNRSKIGKASGNIFSSSRTPSRTSSRGTPWPAPASGAASCNRIRICWSCRCRRAICRCSRPSRTTRSIRRQVRYSRTPS
ncbi:hypothetical protein PACILC2_39420 [Paenibacillus cisolokensis]|uniref:Extracellular solute-binding protein n=1 Tax=Paenibacillus cisolokensis TaxID=1658519 RepID=A0ABQ4NBS0_9BACL|nr:hypothetical protein [Paenibacillus cisolokensis]GIQ65374.1 hypothetical protein PACILC2_39420 [Paenibacillus cisolokensis]